MLHIHQYSKQYGQRPILLIDELRLENKIYWVKGQNGAGKTTLFKSLAGLIPFKGSISIDDIDIQKSPADYRRLINYAEAEPIFPPFLTGQELIEFYSASKSADSSQTQTLIAQFNIGNFISGPVGTYSSGMMKKLSLLLAFIGNPRFILLDEPLVTIEDSFLPTIYELVKSLNRDQKVGFLISSHQALDVRYLPDHAILHVANQTVTCEQ